MDHENIKQGGCTTMPGIITTELGKISISEDIIAMIAGYAASENYGLSLIHISCRACRCIYQPGACKRGRNGSHRKTKRA